MEGSELLPCVRQIWVLNLYRTLGVVRDCGAPLVNDRGANCFSRSSILLSSSSLGSTVIPSLLLYSSTFYVGAWISWSFRHCTSAKFLSSTLSIASLLFLFSPSTALPICPNSRVRMSSSLPIFSRSLVIPFFMLVASASTTLMISRLRGVPSRFLSRLPLCESLDGSMPPLAAPR